MNSTDHSEARRKLAHDARQPLNAIRLITANMKARLGSALGDADGDWAAAKLDKIDRQVDRLVQLLDEHG